MPHVIYKYPVTPSSGSFQLEMPEDAQVLTVQFQDDASGPGGKMWALVDPARVKVKRTFQIFGTGHAIDLDTYETADIKYVGTYQQFGGELVWHLFDLGEVI